MKPASVNSAHRLEINFHLKQTIKRHAENIICLCRPTTTVCSLAGYLVTNLPFYVDI